MKIKNTTVKELIEILQKMDQDAIICDFELENDEPLFSSLEICKEFKDQMYIDKTGNVVVFC